MKPETIVADVPCNGCTACCRSETVILYPEVDEIKEYETEQVTFADRTLYVLKRDASGACVYLGESGCTIHARAPAVCRAFDCRAWFLRFHAMEQETIKTMKKNGFHVEEAVLEAGRIRLGKQ